MSMFRNLMAAGLRRRDPLHGIHYVCDFDAKGRSNDEDEPMRSQWTDKATGKVIDLNNFAFAGMSGWGGDTFDFNEWQIMAGGLYDDTVITKDANKLYISGTILDTEESKNRSGVSLTKQPSGMSYQGRLRIKGLRQGQFIVFADYTGTPSRSIQATSDGIMSYDFLTSTGGSGNMYIYVEVESDARDVNVVIEQLPLYPGALVCDGVDDYGQSAEAIDEEVGTMLAMLEADDDVKRGSYFFNYGKNENANRLYCWTPSDGIPKMGLPSKNIAFPVGVLTRTPSSPADIMYIASYSGGLPSKVALYRLILIREQLDGAQVEFLKSKVIREYNEWCRDKGYDYAIING